MADIFEEMMIDLRKPLQEKMRKEFTQAANDAASMLVRGHFESYTRHTPSGSTREKGAGFLEIEEMLDKMFGSEAMKSKMQQYFDDNFERIFQETMEEGIRHGVRKAVFEDTKLMSTKKADSHDRKN